jgi:hypothetical protein
MAADFLDEKRNEIAARLMELGPLVEEYERLQAAAAALQGVSSGADAPAGARARTSTRTAGSASAGRRGRPQGSGRRSDEALALVKANPGITVAEIAEKMGIKQNYLYRVLPNLAEQGLVVKDGRGWHPAPTS